MTLAMYGKSRKRRGALLFAAILAIALGVAGGVAGLRDRSAAAQEPTAGSITVQKVVQGEDDGTSFAFTGLGNGFSLAGGESYESGDLPPGYYSITEMGAEGWQLVNFGCTLDSGESDGAVGPLQRAAPVGGASVDLQAGQHWTCTFVNAMLPAEPETATLTIVKELVNDGGGTAVESDFTISVMQGDTAVESDPGSAEGVTYELPAGDYVVVEAAHNGYESSIRGACDGDGSITLAAGESYTCIVNNDDIAPDTAMLTIVKELVNDDGGTAVESDFTISVMQGDTAVESDPGSAEGVTYELPAGDYVVMEAEHDGYASSIRGACDGDGSITLVAGESYTCTVSNDDIAPDTAMLTIVKELVNDGGGTAVESDFTISVMQGDTAVESDPGSAEGVTYELPAGDYVVMEAEHDGYASSIRGACDGDGSVTLVAGESYTCVVNNDDIGGPGDTASLTIVKELVNDDEGTAVESDFTISVMQGDTAVESDPGSAEGVTYELPAGDYVVMEAEHGGYESSIRGACDGDGSVSLVAGESYTCVVRNDDSGPGAETGTLTVIKSVVNDDAGTSAAGDFQISVLQEGADVEGSPAAGSETGTVYTLPVGDYTVHEDVYGGYTTALGGDCAADGNITIAAGDELTCTVTNDDVDASEVLGSITVTKTVPAGEGDDTDFTFTGTLPDFVLDVDDDPAYSDTATFTLLPAGTYTIAEAAVEGWEVESITCTGLAAAPTADAGSVTFDLAEGESADCTFNNTTATGGGTGSITIVKAVPEGDADGTDFAFTSTIPGHASFTLDVDDDPTYSDTLVAADLAAGTYTIGEIVPDGWDLDYIQCDGGMADRIAPLEILEDGVDVTLAEGADVTCVFNNIRAATGGTGSITIVKHVPEGEADGTDFAFASTIPGGESFTLDVDDDPTYSDTITFADVAAGAYTVGEIVPEGWDIDEIRCDGGSANRIAPQEVNEDAVDIVLAEDAEVTCHFFNVREPEEGTGNIRIRKSANTVSDDLFPFTIASDGTFSETFTLDIDETDDTYDNEMTWAGLAAGAYVVHEDLSGLDGWGTPSVSCTPAGISSWDGATGELTIDLPADIDVTCTFINRQVDGGGDTDETFVTVNKVGGIASDTFTFDIAGPDSFAQTFTVAGGGTSTVDLDASGGYTITEQAMSGYTYAGWSLADPDGTCPADPANDSTVPLTFTFDEEGASNQELCVYNTATEPEPEAPAETTGLFSSGAPATDVPVANVPATTGIPATDVPVANVPSGAVADTVVTIPGDAGLPAGPAADALPGTSDVVTIAPRANDPGVSPERGSDQPVNSDIVAAVEAPVVTANEPGGRSADDAVAGVQAPVPGAPSAGAGTADDNEREAAPFIIAGLVVMLAGLAVYGARRA